MNLFYWIIFNVILKIVPYDKILYNINKIILIVNVQ